MAITATVDPYEALRVVMAGQGAEKLDRALRVKQERWQGHTMGL
jgi:hypothetical protein